MPRELDSITITMCKSLSLTKSVLSTKDETMLASLWMVYLSIVQDLGKTDLELFK